KYGNNLALFHQFGRIENFSIQLDLGIILNIHKMENISLIVKKLELVGFHADIVNFVAGGKGIVDYFSRGNAFQLCAHESRALSGFYVKEFNNFINVVVIPDAKSFSDV